jgi:FO synthase
VAETIIDNAAHGLRVDDNDALALAGYTRLPALLGAAATRRDRAHGDIVSYSPKVFIPLTHLCRDVCRYCTFAHTPGKSKPAYLSIEQAVAIARAGFRRCRSGCRW